MTGGDYKDCMCGQECGTPGVESSCVFADYLKGEKIKEKKDAKKEPPVSE